MRHRCAISCICRGTAFIWLIIGVPMTAFGDPGWGDVEIRLLPDASFAAIETDDHGRRLRRCPYRDANGHLDVDQLVYVLGTLDRIEWTGKKARRGAEKQLNTYYKRYLGNFDDSPVPVLNINDAPMKDLVRLPGIGPVLAVKIAEYRRFDANFFTLEDVMKVDGISRGIFNAIRHYIEVD
jgi:competence ComEA-like helix-hairpin-helix protein